MDWLIPWHPVEDAADARHAEQELTREVAESHPMFQVPVRVLGYRQDCDNWLFAIDDGSDRVAVVHLTYPHEPPDRPPWPMTHVYPSLDCWIEKVMREDNLDFFCGTDPADGG
jgi:hypothetical protein